MNLPALLLQTIRTHELLARGDRTIVAVSGGADSVALLHALHEVAGELELHLAAAHLNHGIRGVDADADEEFVRSLARELSLECIVERVDVPGVVRERGGSLEDAARRERYAFLGRAAQAAGAAKIAVGHTADDNAETVLLRMLRGAGVRGLGGIPVTRPLARGSGVLIVRPLLGAYRRDILEYLAAKGRSFRTDVTNFDPAHDRNRVRNELIPCIEAVCPGAKESLNRLARGARNHYNLIESMARDLLRRAERPGGGPALDRAVLKAAHPEVAVEALRLALEDAGVRQLSFAQSRRLLRMLSAPTGAAMSLPGGKLLRAEYDVLGLAQQRRGPAPAASVELPLPGSAEFLGRRFEARLVDNRPGLLAEFIRTKDAGQEMLDADRLARPLELRVRRPGDFFRPLGSPGSRKLQDFLVDEKLPAWRRDDVPILCDAAGIVWVAGHRIDERVRVTPGTRRVALVRMSRG